MINGIVILKNDGIHETRNKNNNGSRQNKYRSKLKQCTLIVLKKLNKKHDNLISIKIQSFLELKKHVKNLSTMFKVLGLNRNVENSKFFNESLILISSNTHEEITCQLFKKFINVVNDDVFTITKQVIAFYHTIVSNGKRTGQHDKMSKVFVKIGLVKTRRFRILNIFLKLEIHQQTRMLDLTKNEITINKGIRMNRANLYKFKRGDCSYQKHIDDICNEKHCSKTEIIRRLIKKIGKKKKKTMFATMRSVNVFILYGICLTSKIFRKKQDFRIDMGKFLRITCRARVTFIYASQSKSIVQEIIFLFQKKPLILKRFKNVNSSQYFVEIIKLIDTDYIMTKKIKLIQLNLKGLKNEKRQIRKKINRIFQTNSTFIYFFISIGSIIEELIRNRQNLKNCLISMTMIVSNANNNAQMNELKQ